MLLPAVVGRLGGGICSPGKRSDASLARVHRNGDGDFRDVIEIIGFRKLMAGAGGIDVGARFPILSGERWVTSYELRAVSCKPKLQVGGG